MFLLAIAAVFLVRPAAATLPWACPALDAPPDGPQFRTDAGLEATFDALEDEARTWWDDDCAWTSTTLSDGSTEESCTTDAGATVTYTSYSWEGSYDTTDWNWVETWSLEVVAPAGEGTWTEIALSSHATQSYEGMASGLSLDLEASWSGAPPDVPEDGGFSYAYRSSTYIGTLTETTIATPDCSWSWGWDSDAGYAWVDAGGHEAEAWMWRSECLGHVTQAHYDGVLYGHVDWTTWELDEADGDGWSVAAGDCDDTDPTVYPCATEEAVGDGWDQDCDGGDDLDDDGDGYVSEAYGGDDCNDGNRGFHPGADDTAGDGWDQNCDGADEVDQDGDGYTVDGDDGSPDCDDADRGAYPGAYDRPYDGLDQDCDGGDRVDVDFDGDAAIEAGGGDCDDREPSVHTGAPETECDGIDQDCDEADFCPPGEDEAADVGGAEGDRATGAAASDDNGTAKEGGGCGSGSASLLLLPLAALRGRRRRP